MSGRSGRQSSIVPGPSVSLQNDHKAEMTPQTLCLPFLSDMFGETGQSNQGSLLGGATVMEAMFLHHCWTPCSKFLCMEEHQRGHYNQKDPAIALGRQHVRVCDLHLSLLATPLSSGFTGFSTPSKPLSVTPVTFVFKMQCRCPKQICAVPKWSQMPGPLVCLTRISWGTNYHCTRVWGERKGTSPPPQDSWDSRGHKYWREKYMCSCPQ